MITSRYSKEGILSALRGRIEDFYFEHDTPLMRIGNDLRGPCAIHGGRGFNFTVDPETGAWYCFSQCQEGGDLFDFVMRVRSLSFTEALQYLGEWLQASPEPPRESLHPARPVIRSQESRSLPSNCEEIAEACHKQLLRDETMFGWLLERRGWTLDTILRFQLGEIVSEGIKRVTFPVRDQGGQLVNIRKHLFSYALEISPEVRRRLGKTLPWSRGLPAELYPLSAIVGTEEAVILEGEGDAILGCQLGLPCVTGTAGAGCWHEEWNRHLSDKRRVTLLYDADAAGNKGMSKVAASLHAAGITVYIARLPVGKDLTEAVIEHGMSIGEIGL